MKLCHTVHRKAANNGKVSHANLLHITLLDNRHTTLTFNVARPALGHLREEAGIDLINNFKDPWQQAAKQVDRPSLQCLGKQRMIGISHGFTGDRPCLIPLQTMLVDQQSHQLSYSDCRVGIVELEYIFIGKLIKISAMLLNPLAQYVFNAG